MNGGNVVVSTPSCKATASKDDEKQLLSLKQQLKKAEHELMSFQLRHCYCIFGSRMMRKKKTLDEYVTLQETLANHQKRLDEARLLKKQELDAARRAPPPPPPRRAPPPPPPRRVPPPSSRVPPPRPPKAKTQEERSHGRSGYDGGFAWVLGIGAGGGGFGGGGGDGGGGFGGCGGGDGGGGFGGCGGGDGGGGCCDC